MSKTLEDLGHYEYRCLDGKTVLKFRTMSAKERRRLFFETKRWSWIVNGMRRAQDTYDLDMWDRQFQKLAEVVSAIAIPGDTAKKFSRMTDQQLDVNGVMARIMQVELALNDGEEMPEQENLIPTEDEVEDAPPSELEKMGEESPAEDHTPTT